MMYLLHELKYFTDLNNKMYQFILFLQPLFTLIFVFLISSISARKVSSQQIFYSALTSMLTYVLYSDGAIIYSEKMNGTMELIEAAPIKLYTIVLTKSLCNSLISFMSFIITILYSGIFFRTWFYIDRPVIFVLIMLLLLFSLTSFGTVCGFFFGNTKNLYNIQNAIIPPFLLVSGIWNTSNQNHLLLLLRKIGRAFPIEWVIELATNQNLSAGSFLKCALPTFSICLIYLFFGYWISGKVEKSMRKEGKYNEFQ